MQERVRESSSKQGRGRRRERETPQADSLLGMEPGSDSIPGPDLKS